MGVLRIVSADTHVFEPPNLWVEYLEIAYKAKAPRIVNGPEADMFVCEGLPTWQLNAGFVAGRRNEEIRRTGQRFERDVPKGAWEPHARIKEQEKDGVDAEVLYATLGMHLFRLQNVDFQAACFRAYNDWLADFCSAYPTRMKGVGLLTGNDINRDVVEMRRIRQRGLVGVMLSVYPDEDRPYSSPEYDQLWAAAEELDMPVILHPVTERGRPVTKTFTQALNNDISIRTSIAQMVVGGVFERFPTLKIVSAENDLGWLPYFLERLDYLLERRKVLYQPVLSGKYAPSELVLRNVFFTFIRDHSWVPSRKCLRLDHIMWGSDYPHTDSTWPDSRKVLQEALAGLPHEERQQVTLDNAIRLYGF